MRTRTEGESRRPDQLVHSQRQTVEPTELLTDRPRSAAGTARREAISVDLPAPLTQAAGEGAPPHLVFLTALQVLLLRYTGSEEICMGTIETAGSKEQVLALCTDLSGEIAFRDALARTESAVSDARAQQQPAQDAGARVVFQFRESVRDSQFAACDAAFTVEPLDQGHRLTCNYDAGLFKRETIRRMVGHYQNLLEATATHPDVPVTRLPLLTEAERRQILSDWRGLGDGRPVERCCHHLFEEQAARTPLAVAVEYRGEQLTYEDLNRRANQLAHYLQLHGVGPEVRVGICLEHSPDMIVAMLGVLKAGGAYVPLDPGYPADRLAFMIDDAGLTILLSQQKLLLQIPAHTGRNVTLDADWAEISRQSQEPPSATVGLENLAYVIYTSGSTGRPKGVLVEHRGIANLALAQIRDFAVTPESRVLQFASFSFDASVSEIWITLLAGATLCLEDREALVPGLGLIRLLRERAISVVTLPPSALAIMPAAELPALRTIISAGEAVSTELVARWAPGRRFCNAYGPTEATVCATIGTVVAGDDQITIGRPMAHTLVCILDRYMQPVPPGVPGELYIGGVGVARGYLNRPELTAQRFISDPFSPDATGRLYRTGDRARFLFDGQIEFLGRLDQQVKIRGFRVELGEIETLLGRHPDVQAAVVVDRQDNSGERTLAAYVVPAAGRSVLAASLRAHLKEHLPEYMVPRAFITMNELPYTPNGKLDRRALPEPDWAEIQLNAEYVPPRNELERTCASIWAEVLKIPRVGIHDDFFELGGHSLAGARIAFRLWEACGLELPFRAFFEAPTVEALAALISERLSAGTESAPVLSKAETDEYLASFLNDAPPGSLPSESTRVAPTSYSQQQLWFLDQYQPDSPFYNLPVAFRLHGPLDRNVLEQSLNEVECRHELLRTTYASVNDRPVQVVAPPRMLSLPYVNLRHLEEAEREPEAMKLLLQQAWQPYDLQKGPMLRRLLVRLAEEEYLLLLTLHHIAADGWSMDLLFGELSSLYSAFAAGQASPLAPLSFQYVDYAVWQQSTLQSEFLDSHLRFWKERLAGAPALLELPTDFPRPAVQTFRGARLTARFPRELADAVRSVSRREGVTLFMTLMAAFQVLLHRYTGQEDLLVGTPVANRSRREFEALIGFVANSIVVRGDLTGNPSVRDVLARTRDQVLDAQKYQILPFEKLVEALKPERSLSYSPLFQVMFALQNPIRDVSLPGVEVTPIDLPVGSSKYDLTLEMVERPDGLEALLTYSTDLFTSSTMERMLGHFERVLAAFADDPGQRVATLPILTDPERRQLLEEWIDTAAAQPLEPCVHRQLEVQAKADPTALAVVCEEKSLTFGELNQQANQIAHLLQKYDVKPDTRVGICFDRSVEMIVALLATLKAGGCYVALDPAMPPDRMTYLVNDAQVAVLLTSSDKLEILPVDRQPVICLDRDLQTIQKQPVTNPDSGVTSDHLVYVIYTSGSTGKPKGVGVSHRNLGNYLSGIRPVLDLPKGASYATVSTLAADLGNTVIFPSLCHGGTLHVITRERASDPEHLAAYFRSNPIDCLKIVPSHMAALLSASSPADVLPRRRLVMGGEASSWELVERIRTLAPACTVINHYGPTETTVGVLTCRVEGSRDEISLTVPLGRPIQNTEIFLLDRNLQPVPVGVAGELYIGGLGVTRGYLGRPELTAERFVANPFRGARSKRLYRTGDLARYLPDGRIEFLGRVDHQVKIRGYRIEPGEVEALLKQHPAVTSTVVTTYDGPAGDKRMAAYIVTDSARRVPVDELRALLREKLPDYMVPSAMILLEALPLTANGKIDRRALPAPASGQSDPVAAFVAPRTEVEGILAGVWGQILGLERVGVFDSFFDLGGQSLLATQLISRVKTAFQVDISLRTLFEAPTVAGMAAAIAAALRKGQGLQRQSMAPVSREQAIPLSFAQQRLWFLAQLEPESSVYNMPSVFRIRGPLDVAAFEKALLELVRRHESLRTTFRSTDGEPVQVILPLGNVRLEFLDLRALSTPAERETEASRLIDLEARHRFDLATGPLVRVRLVQLGNAEYLLLLTLHHIISDGWSNAIIYQELAALYEAFAAGKPSPLADPALHYADFACRQREWLRGEALEQMLSYWRERLSGAPALLELPTDRPRPPVQSFSGGLCSLRLSPDLTRSIRTLSRREGVTAFMTLLAAFKVVLSRHSGQSDVVVGTPVAGRNRTEIEEMVGFFINTLVLRTDLSGDPSFRTLLSRIREVTLGAFVHQDLPFEKLVEALQPVRTPSHTPLFQVMFNWLDKQEGLRLPGLDVERMTAGMPGSKFDMTLYASDEADEIHLTALYNADLFDEQRVVLMLQQCETLLGGLTSSPEMSVHTAALLSTADEAVLLDPAQPLDGSWHISPLERFVEQARRVPGKVALVDSRDTWTYGELDFRSNQLAHSLRESGICPQDVVAIYGHRSASLIWAMLGIMKAGAAWVILDPAYPTERLLDCLGSAAPRGWIEIEAAGTVPSALQDALNKGGLCCRVSLPRRSDLAANHWSDRFPADPPDLARDSDALAYIAFTSGSTGKPKAIMGSHRPLGHFLNWHCRTFGLVESDRFSVLSGLAHDPLLRDILTPLWVGASLHIPDPERIAEPNWLAGWLRREQITVSHLTPPMAQLIAEGVTSHGKQVLESLRWAFFGGDRLTGRVVAQMRELAPAVVCVNFYGATETPQAMGYAIVADPEALGPGQIVPLGRGIADVQLLVLNPSGQRAAIGELGEVYVRTPYLTVGYRGDEELTRARFVTNPFTGDQGDRLYRTGDLGRYLPNGDVAYVGRGDQQVKVRGFRVELGDVEAALRGHPAIDQAVVTAGADALGMTRLAAYMQPDPEATVTQSELREYLQQRLPDYMIPSAFVLVAAMPLTPNGKIDRRVLPEPDFQHRETEELAAAPRTAVEEVVAGVWAELLQVETVGAFDNFFAHGGHSLLATRLMARLEDLFQVAVPLAAFFRMPTVAGIAAALLDGPARARVEKTAALLVMLSQMSDEEVEQKMGQSLGGSQS